MAEATPQVEKQEEVGADGRPIQDKNRAAFRYAVSLAESARGAAQPYTKTFRPNWEFLLGKNHFAAPLTAAAFLLDEWSCKSVRNWLFAAVDHKNAVISDAEPSIFVDPLDDQTTYWQRAQIQAVIEHECKRLNWGRVLEDMTLQGAATGIGVALRSVKPDPMAMPDPETLDVPLLLTLSSLDPADCYPDPSADCLEECRFFVWEPLLDMSTIRAMFPSKADQVKPTTSNISNVPSQTFKSTSNDDQLIFGPAMEFDSDSKGTLKSRKARTSFVWIKEEKVIDDLKRTILVPPQPGQKCVSCGYMYEEGALPEGATQCSVCGGNLMPTEIPAKTSDTHVFSRPFPFGHLIVRSGETLLYDGPNPEDLEGVFPLSIYHHYRIPGSFYGYGDVALGKSLQNVADITIGQLVDYIRMAVNGPFEFPANEPGYASLGNGPAQRIPIKRQNAGVARFITPGGFNVAAWQTLDETNNRDFQRELGVTDVSTGIAPTAPTSGVEVQARIKASSTRIGSHLRRRNSAASQIARLIWAGIKQHYTNPMSVMMRMPDSSVRSISVDIQKLPTNVNVYVTCDVDTIEKDRNMGQNIAGLAQSGLIPPYLDILLPAVGIGPARAREVMQRIQLEQEMQQGGQPGMPPNYQPTQMPQPQGPPAPRGLQPQG